MEEIKREELCGQAFVSLDLMAQRCLEDKGASFIDHYLKDLHVKPLATLQRAFTEINQYDYKFKEVEWKLRDIVIHALNDLTCLINANEPLETHFIDLLCRYKLELYKEFLF